MNPNRFSFPAILTPDHINGGFVVTFQDLPEAITQGENWDEALREAEDCLDEAIAGRIQRKDEIPIPSKPKKGQPIVWVPAQTAMKAALFLTMREARIEPAQLAKMLNCQEDKIERLLNPKYRSNISLLQSAMTILGKKIALTIIEAA